jgi:hypothetical protein
MPFSEEEAIMPDGPVENRHVSRNTHFRVFELLQPLTERWVTEGYSAKQKIHRIAWLNLTLDDSTLCYERRKPFNILACGLLLLLSGGKRTPVELFLEGVTGWEVKVCSLADSLSPPPRSQDCS